MCLMCQKTFSNKAMKLSRQHDHFNKIHSDMKDKDVTYFQNMKNKYVAQPTLSTLFSAASKQDNDGLNASYNISLLITKTDKPYRQLKIIRKIPLTNNSV